MNRDDLLWLSGFLEGEGCFTRVLGRSGKKEVWHAKVAVENTDEDVMQRVKQLIGAKMLGAYESKRYKGAKKSYVAAVTGPKALALMLEVYPYMGSRRKDRILKLLSAWEHSHEVALD